MPQTTIARPVEIAGVGLHSGGPARLRLSPADRGGRQLVDPDGIAWPARIDRVVDDARATRLAPAPEAAGVSTVEHLLAALAACEIDHLRIEVEGGEVPCLDGSAMPFVELIERAGRRDVAGAEPAALGDTGAPRAFEGSRPSPGPIRLEAPIEVRDADRSIRAEPADTFGFAYAIDFAHPAIGRQSFAVDRLTPERFAREIAPARTFGFLEDLETLRAAGLAGGASLENTLVFDDTGVVNEGPLRFPDECVRHKAIDLIGDLALLGAPLRAFVTAHKAGHRLHHALVREIEARREGAPPARTSGDRGA